MLYVHVCIIISAVCLELWLKPTRISVYGLKLIPCRRPLEPSEANRDSTNVTLSKTWWLVSDYHWHRFNMFQPWKMKYDVSESMPNCFIFALFKAVNLKISPVSCDISWQIARQASYRSMSFMWILGDLVEFSLNFLRNHLLFSTSIMLHRGISSIQRPPWESPRWKRRCVAWRRQPAKQNRQMAKP